MFWILLIVGGFGACICGYLCFMYKERAIIAVPLTFLFVVLFVSAWLTSSGQIYYAQLLASGLKGNWLVVDNSGGETLRHWVLEERYVKDSQNSDGWNFRDQNGNLCYVSGDAFVMQIKQPLKKFLKNYKGKYNLPQKQKALK